MLLLLFCPFLTLSEAVIKDSTNVSAMTHYFIILSSLRYHCQSKQSTAHVRQKGASQAVDVKEVLPTNFPQLISGGAHCILIKIAWVIKKVCPLYCATISGPQKFTKIVCIHRHSPLSSKSFSTTAACRRRERVTQKYPRRVFLDHPVSFIYVWFKWLMLVRAEMVYWCSGKVKHIAIAWTHLDS